MIDDESIGFAERLYMAWCRGGESEQDDCALTEWKYLDLESKMRWIAVGSVALDILDQGISIETMRETMKK